MPVGSGGECTEADSEPGRHGREGRAVGRKKASERPRVYIACARVRVRGLMPHYGSNVCTSPAEPMDTLPCNFTLLQNAKNAQDGEKTNTVSSLQIKEDDLIFLC